MRNHGKVTAAGNGKGEYTGSTHEDCGYKLLSARE
jgi:hypothetical protein